MDLRELLSKAYSEQENYRKENFIPRKTAIKIVTADRIDKWSKSHPLCLEHNYECPQRNNLIHQVSRTSVYVFIVLVFARLEILTKRLMACNFNDAKLFDTKCFERICKDARLDTEQVKRLKEYRPYVGVIFADNASQDIPDNAVLPFLKRNELQKYGSYGILFRVEIPAIHLSRYNDTVSVAEKRIGPDTSVSELVWERRYHEVETLRKRSNHPNITPLLASYFLNVDDSGNRAKSLHLLFPLAEMDLADWMSKSQIPSNVKDFPKEDRQAYLYRSIYGLVSGVSYLHREIDGKFTAHHDLKPRNILVFDDMLKIADFGESHLRPSIDGSATERASGLGTYEYQPPEYYADDGSRAPVKHGRAFDVWAMGCIITELAILIVDDWQSRMVSEFRDERGKNSRENRKPTEKAQGDDVSFHNNLNVVMDWLGRLEQPGNTQLNEVLSIAHGMLALQPENRPFMWETEMDLHGLLKSHDPLIPDLEGDPCVRPPTEGMPMSQLMYLIPDSRPKVQDHTETPLHRAARKNHRERTIRLWELGWPLSLPNANGETPRDIIKGSNRLKLLEEDVRLMLEAAKTGNIGRIRELLGRGLSPLMVNIDGRSALYEAISSSKLGVVEFLLESKAKEQLMLLDKEDLQYPLHKAASIGFVEGLSRMLKDHPDVNVYGDEFHTALYHAAENCHTDAVRELIQNNARLLPPGLPYSSAITPLSIVLQQRDRAKVYDIVKLLLKADDAHECMERGWRYRETPLMLAAARGHIECFEVLLDHGADLHATDMLGMKVLHHIAEAGQSNLLQNHIAQFTLEELEARGNGRTPLEVALDNDHKEFAQRLKDGIHQAKHSGGDGGNHSHRTGRARDIIKCKTQ